MLQCVNTKCLKVAPDRATHCLHCGSKLLINGRLKATKLLSCPDNIFSHKEAQTFEAVDTQTQHNIVLRIVQSNNPDITTPLLESVLALRKIHRFETVDGFMKLTDEGYFTWKVADGDIESHFLATDKVEGTPLDQWLNEHGPISQRLAAQWLKQLIQTIDYLHQEGFVHQDIKPSNIIVADDNKQLTLIDLGAIRYINPRESLHPEIQNGTKTYPVVGSLGYQAPEQAEGYPTPSSDYYSISRTIIHLLTGIPPVNLKQKDNGTLDWRELTRKELDQVSSKFADLIDRIASPSYLERPRDADDITQHLDVLETEQTQKPTVKASFRQKTKKWATALAIASTLLLVGGSALSIRQNKLEAVEITKANELLNEGNQLIQIGAADQAISLLEDAATILSEDADIHATLALAYALSGKTETAIRQYLLALEIEYDNVLIHYNLANVYERIDLQRAVEHYKIAAQTDSPIRAEATNNLARVYILEDELDKANTLASLDIPSEATTEAQRLKNLGWIQFEKGNQTQALNLLAQSLELDSAKPDAYCLAAIIKQQQGRDNTDDKVTCLSLPMPEQKPEVQAWKTQLAKINT